VSYFGNLTAQLNIDASNASIYQEAWLAAYAHGLAEPVKLKMLVATCGTRFAF
jgi:hypothetical protein